MNIILLVHRQGKIPVRVITSHGKEISWTQKNCTDLFWELGLRFPDYLIGWCEESLEDLLVLENWESNFHHNLIMASYAVKTKFLPEQIGYIDQFPFVNVNPSVNYGTWRMSSDVGGIKGSVLSRFGQLFGKIQNFDYLLNSIAKVGQQNGLFCYSSPNLVEHTIINPPSIKGGNSHLFSFVSQHYNSLWTTGLLLAFIIYEKSLPLGAYVQSFFGDKFFKKKIDFSGIELESSRGIENSSIDVIIPTIGRANYLHLVLKDFASQTLLPKKIIIVEQNSDHEANSELSFIYEEDWPFEVIHQFIHKVGVCNARNLALENTTSEWIFLSDDDQRFEPDLLEIMLSEINRYGTFSLTTSYLQPNEKKFFIIPKQWATFGSGNSIINKRFLERVRFSPVFEYGYGEDVDFGMQLRNHGCDIMYHPSIEIQHLKAPIGGFREVVRKPWDDENIVPKPSPTVMSFARKHYTKEQLLGYQMELFLRFYSKQSVKNPFKYLKQMKLHWRKSEEYAEMLAKKVTQENTANNAI